MGALLISVLLGFNPHPPIKAGEMTTRASLRSRSVFQSAPANKGGRNPISALISRCRTLFQSAPANKGGRNQTDAPIQSVESSFNPHPPIKAGEISVTSTSPTMRKKFQSAPANKGGRNFLFYCQQASWFVSIRTRQ